MTSKPCRRFRPFLWVGLVCLLFPAPLQAEWWHGIVVDEKVPAVFSFYENGQQDWSAQMYTDNALGLKAMWTSDSAKTSGWYWDFSLNLLQGGSRVQSLNTSTDNPETRDAPSAYLNSYVHTDRLESVFRLYLPMLDSESPDADLDYFGLNPFVGFGYSLVKFGGFTYRTRGEGVSELCRQGVETRNTDLVEGHCDRISTQGTVGLPILRFGLTYRQLGTPLILFLDLSPRSIVVFSFGIQAPNEFTLGNLRVRSHSQYWGSAEVLF